MIQLTFEVPIERTAEVFNMLGSPRSGESLWCAIAPLNLKAVQAEPSTSSEPKANGSPKKFHEMPLSQQAALRSQDALFQEFMLVENEEDAAAKVRRQCRVETRSQIVSGSPAGALWLQIESQYQAWATDRKFAEAKR